MTMPLYVSMHNNANLSNADVNATGFQNPYETHLNEQQAHLNTLLKLANEEKNQAPYNEYIRYMSALTKDPNNSNIWKDATSFLNRYEHNPQGFMQEYPKTLTGMNLYKPVSLNNTTANTNTPDLTKPVNSILWDTAFRGVDKYGSAGDREKIAGMENTLGNYQILNKIYEDVKPGFFGNIWNKIVEQPGAFTQSALNIWNSYNAYKANKEYMNLARESFDLQKQQYLDREDRAKKEFAALQSRRAGSSL